MNRGIISIACMLLFTQFVAADEPALPHWIDIDWKRGPDLPLAFQDSDGGIVGDMLISTCGYSDSRDTIPPSKKDKSPVGFHKKTFGLNLTDPSKGWQTLPDWPGDLRQELCAVVVADHLFAWGGFSYEPPFAHRDGYRLFQKNGQWQWHVLPDLPWPDSSFGITAINDSIYVFGGADYDFHKYFTNTDRAGRIQRFGSRLLFADAGVMNDGFREKAQCPGTPRQVAAFAAVKGKLYVIGGATGQDNSANAYCTVVDNWTYDPETDKWDRLPDTPIATGNFPAGAIVYADRYILLIGGYQYPLVMNPDGTTRKSFGHLTKHYPEKDYFSDVLVYDTQTKTFGSATPLPLNNNMPMAVLRGDTLHLIGGETAGSVIDGEPYAHHPDLYLTGKLSLAK